MFWMSFQKACLGELLRVGLGPSTVIFVRPLNLRGIGRSAVNPDAISAGDRFTGRKRLRCYSRPAHGQQPIMARHPGGRIVRMAGMDEHRYAAQVAAAFASIVGYVRP